MKLTTKELKQNVKCKIKKKCIYFCFKIYLHSEYLNEILKQIDLELSNYRFSSHTNHLLTGVELTTRELKRLFWCTIAA